jgi:hypothetical protein
VVHVHTEPVSETVFIVLKTPDLLCLVVLYSTYLCKDCCIRDTVSQFVLQLNVSSSGQDTFSLDTNFQLLELSVVIRVLCFLR